MTAEAAAPAPQGAGALRWMRSPWLLLAPVLLLATAALTSGPVVETDVFWHIPLGEDLLRLHSVHGAGGTWSYTTPHSPWITTEWLAEVVLAGVHRADGFQGVIWLRVALSLAVTARLCHVLMTGGSPRARCLVAALAAVPVITACEERPQLVSFLLLVGVARWSRRVLAGGGLPRLSALLAVTLLWAQIHGYWELTPVALGLLTVCRLISRDTTALRGLALRVVATLAVGCLTPVGPALLTAPLRLRAATSIIVEWAPTSVAYGGLWLLFALVAVLVICWTRDPHPVPLGELAWVGAWLAYSLLAIRNVVPAIILVSPVVADRLARAWPERMELSGTERRILAGTAGALAVAALVTAGVRVAVEAPLRPGQVPLAIIDRLRSEPGEHRVLDGYNISGRLIAFAGAHTRVAVDGRSDRYGGRYLHAYVALGNLTGNWEDALAKLAPTHAVLPAGTPLIVELHHRGWTDVVTDHGYLLLEPSNPAAVAASRPAACLPSCLT